MRAFIFPFIYSLLVVVPVLGQGFLNVGNSVSGFRMPIYGYEPLNPGLSIHGQSSIGRPAGTTAYTGALLQGAGYTFAIYYGLPGVTNADELSLLTSTTFRTASHTGALPEGLVNFQNVTVPGVAADEWVALEVRAWDNQGGTLTTWETATNALPTAFGRSGLFVPPQVLGGVTSDGAIIATPFMSGWSSFNIVLVPEPSAALLALLAAPSFAVWRLRPRLQFVVSNKQPSNS